MRFEEIFGKSKGLGATGGAMRRKMKSVDQSEAKECFDEESNLYGTGKHRIRVLRDNIASLTKKLVDMAGPLVKLHKRLREPHRMEADPMEKTQADLVSFLLQELERLRKSPADSSLRVSHVKDRLGDNTPSRAGISTLSKIKITMANDKHHHREDNDMEDQKDVLLSFFGDEEQPKEQLKKHDRLDDIGSYNFIKILGKGAYGVVWLVRRRQTYDLYAMKLSE